MIRFSTILFLIFLLSALPERTLAQQPETLLSGDIRHGGFGSLVFGVTSVNGQAAYLTGTRGAWSLRFADGQTLHIGLAGYSTENGFDAVNVNNASLPELDLHYGGFETEYLNNSNSLIHYGGQLLVGAGTVRYRDRVPDLAKRSDSIFTIQPGANIHLNITNWFRINGGVTYRLVNGSSLEGTSNSELSGFSAIIGLRFGWF